MTQAIIKLAGIINILLMGVILLPRVMPLDDHDLRMLLLPDDCIAPCFMGIKAGETAEADAFRLIHDHAWVQADPFFVQPINDINLHMLYWKWSGQQPKIVDSNWQGQLQIFQHEAARMIVRTRAQLGDVWLLLGATEKGTVILSESRPATDVTLIFVYPPQSLLVRVNAPKSFSLWAVWDNLVEIEFTNPQAIDYFSRYALPSLSLLDSQ